MNGTDDLGEGLVPSRLAGLHDFDPGGRKGRPTPPVSKAYMTPTRRVALW